MSELEKSLHLLETQLDGLESKMEGMKQERDQIRDAYDDARNRRDNEGLRTYGQKWDDIETRILSFRESRAATISKLSRVRVEYHMELFDGATPEEKAEMLQNLLKRLRSIEN